MQMFDHDAVIEGPLNKTHAPTIPSLIIKVTMDDLAR